MQESSDILMVTTFCKKTQINISNGEWYIGKNLGENRYKLLGVPSWWIYTRPHFLLLVTTCPKYYQYGKFTQPFVSRVSTRTTHLGFQHPRSQIVTAQPRISGRCTIHAQGSLPRARQGQSVLSEVQWSSQPAAEPTLPWTELLMWLEILIPSSLSIPVSLDHLLQPMCDLLGGISRSFR